MKLISFIGTGELHETTYRLGERTFRSTCVQEAVAKFFPVDQVIIFATEGAARKTAVMSRPGFRTQRGFRYRMGEPRRNSGRSSRSSPGR